MALLQPQQLRFCGCDPPCTCQQLRLILVPAITDPQIWDPIWPGKPFSECTYRDWSLNVEADLRPVDSNSTTSTPWGAQQHEYHIWFPSGTRYTFRCLQLHHQEDRLAQIRRTQFLELSHFPGTVDYNPNNYLSPLAPVTPVESPGTGSASETDTETDSPKASVTNLVSVLLEPLAGDSRTGELINRQVSIYLWIRLQYTKLLISHWKAAHATAKGLLWIKPLRFLTRSCQRSVYSSHMKYNDAVFMYMFF